MTIFSPDGTYGYVCSSFNPVLVVFDAHRHSEVARVPQPSPFCPNIGASPDGKQVWYTLKDIGKTVVIDARPPFNTLRVLDTGPITNHVNFVDNANGQFAYVTVGGLNEIQVFRRGDFAKVATIPVGQLPHGIWPSGDGTRIYVGLENADAIAVIDTLKNKLVATVPVGQAPQALVYVPNAAPGGRGQQNLMPLGVAGSSARLVLLSLATKARATDVTLFDQGLIQVFQASVTGLHSKSKYVLALAAHPDGKGDLEPLAAFSTNPAGAAIVSADGPIRQLVRDSGQNARRYLVIAPGTPDHLGPVVQAQAN